MGYNLPTYLERRDGVYYFVRRIPSDVLKHYRRHRIRQSLRTKSEARAMRMVSSMSQRLEDYWLGLRLQDLDIPSIALVRAGDSNQPNCGVELTDALDLYLRLKGDGRDKVFGRAARRNIGYVVEALGNRPLDQYASSDAALFRDWLIARDMAGNTVRRVFSSIRSIVNLAIKEQGLECQNAFAGTFMPDGMRETARNPISTDDLKSIQARCLAEDDDLRWLIALLSDTGMRLGEAVGLLKADVHLENDLPHIKLAPHPWRRLKTPGSARIIPLVGMSLWAAQRVIASETDTSFAFPRYCSANDHNTNSSSAALNKWLKQQGPSNSVIHSFRHSLRDRLRAIECPSDVIDQIGGWSTPGVGSNYGKGYTLEVMHRWLARIQETEAVPATPPANSTQLQGVR